LSFKTLKYKSDENARAVGAAWLVSAPAGPALRLSLLVAPGRLEALIGEAARLEPDGACRRAIASVWSKRLFQAVLSAALTADLLGEAPDDDPLLTLDGHLVAAAVVAWPGPPRRHPVEDWIDGTMAPAIGRLSAAGGLSPRVFWSNAAAMAAWLYEHWMRLPGWETAAASRRHAVVEADRPDRRPNPLRDHIVYRPCAVPGYESGARMRKVCCLRDRLGQRLCAGCPKIDPAARDRLLAGEA